MNIEDLKRLAGIDKQAKDESKKDVETESVK